MREGLQVVLHVAQMTAQRIEQRFVRGRVCLANVVDRLHQSAAKVMGPQAIDDRPREERVLGIGSRQPLGQPLAAITDVGEIGWRGSQRSSRN